MTADAATANTPSHAEGGHALIVRIRFVIAMAVSALIFWHVGWSVVGPADPEAPVTLLALDHGVVGMAEMLGLSVAAAGLATAICGARSAHRGPMAVAVGFAAMGLRGGYMDEFVRRRILEQLAAGGAAARAAFPRGEFIAENWLWISLIGVGFVVGRWVESWYGPEPAASPAKPTAPVDSAAEVRQGLGALVLNVLVAYNLIWVMGGRDADAMEKGQIYFSIGGAFFLGTLLSHLCFRATSRVWLLVAVAIVTAAAYLFNAPPASSLSTSGYVVLHPIVRAMPMEFAALGVVGALAGFNARDRLTTSSDEDDKPGG